MCTNRKIFIGVNQIIFMYEEVLAEIGLSKSEIAVYLALLKIGSSTTGPIIKMASISSGKIYPILDKLIKKGLVTYAITSGIKHYQAKDPEKLIDYLDEKEKALIKKKEDLKKILPALKTDYEKNKYIPRAEIYEGVKGFRSFYEFALKELKENETIYVMGIPKEANEKFQSFLLEWNKERIQKKVHMRILFNSDCKKEGRLREKMKLTEVRYMDPELETPVWTDIFQDYVTIINVHSDPLCFLIRNKESAEAYKKYFNFIWNRSTK